MTMLLLHRAFDSSAISDGTPDTFGIGAAGRLNTFEASNKQTKRGVIHVAGDAIQKTGRVQEVGKCYGISPHTQARQAMTR